MPNYDLIIKVLTYEYGTIGDPDLEAYDDHKGWIRDRYWFLTRTEYKDFSTAALQSKSEWLQYYLTGCAFNEKVE